jgi:ferredoxin
MPSPSDPRTVPALTVDRIACTGHGVCASLLPDEITLDEWGYPVVHISPVDPELGDIAVRLCPARALAWAARP